MIVTDLIGRVVECPTGIDQRYEPTGWGVGIIVGVMVRTTSSSAFPEIIVQTLDHMVGKAPKPIDAGSAWTFGGNLRHWDLKHCRMMSSDKARKLFEPKP